MPMKKNSDTSNSKGSFTSLDKSRQPDIASHDGKDAHWRDAAQDKETEETRDAARGDEQGHKPP